MYHFLMFFLFWDAVLAPPGDVRRHYRKGRDARGRLAARPPSIDDVFPAWDKE